MTPGNAGGGATYAINIPIQTYGRENLDRIAEAISKTSQVVKISAQDFATWQSSMERASDSGYTLNTSITQVAKTMSGAASNIHVFTDRLRENIREQEALQSTAGRTEAVLGRVSGRIGGAVLGGAAGLPGGGFIGSQLFQSLGISGGTALAAGGAVIGATAAYEAYKQAEDTAKYAQQIQNLSKELGTTTGQTQILGRVSEVTGIQTNALFQTLRAMNRELTETGPKSTQVGRALNELGLSTGIAFKQPYEQLLDILGALKKLDQASRERVAINLLGESQSAGGFSGRSLLALVDNYKDVVSSVKGTGVILGDDTVTNMSKFAQDSKLASLSWTSIGQSIGETTSQIATWASKGFLFALNTLPGNMGARFGQPSDRKTKEPDDLTSEQRATASLKEWLGAGRLTKAKDLEMAGLSPVERLDAEHKRLLSEATSDLSDYKLGRTPPSAYIADRKRILANEAAKKRQEELERQQHTFSELRPTDEMSPDEMSGELKNFHQRYSLILGSSGARQRLQTLQQGQLVDQNNVLGRSAVGRNDIFMKEEAGAIHKGLQRDVKEAVEQVRDQLENVRNSDTAARGEEASGIASGKIQRALSSDASTYGMTPMQIARRVMNESIENAGAEAIPKGIRLGREIESRTNALGELQGVGIPGDKADDERQRLSAELIEKQLDLRAQETDAQLKSIDAIKKWNDAVDKSNEAMRSQFGGGFASVVMGFQRGGGKGGLSALKGFFEGEESTVLKNIGEKIYGQGGSIHAKSGTFLGDILHGTIGGPIEKREDASKPLKEAAQDLKDAAKALRGGGTANGGAPGSGIYGVDGTADGTALANIVNAQNGASVPTPSTAAGTAVEIGDLAGAAASLSTVTTGSTSAALKAVAGTFSKLDSVLKGTKYAGNFGKIFSGTLGTGQEIGAIAGTAALGIGAYEGIATAAKGGAKNVTGGIAGTLAAIGPATGPAAPYVEAAAALVGLVSSFLPDLRQKRGEQESKNLFGQRYQAPQAENISESSNGSYSDFDIHGNARVSNLSPYPIVSSPYLDVPRRTVVPGHTISTFGGYSGTPSANVYPSTPRVNGNAGAPTYNITVQAIDAQSILDRADHIVDAFHKGIQQNAHPVVGTLAQQMGVRG